MDIQSLEIQNDEFHQSIFQLHEVTSLRKNLNDQYVLQRMLHLITYDYTDEKLAKVFHLHRQILLFLDFLYPPSYEKSSFDSSFYV